MTRKNIEHGRYRLEEVLKVESRELCEQKRLLVLCEAICHCHAEYYAVPNEWLQEIRSLACRILTTRVEECP